MDLRQLETIIAIAEAGSFTGAAAVLLTVQSNVSDQVRQLERELGCQLFTRGRLGAVLTDLGEVVVERGRRILREVDALEADITSKLDLQAGHVSVGVESTISRWLTPKLASALRHIAPRLHINFVEASSERLTELVVSQELPQAVVSVRGEDPRLEVKALFTQKLIAIVPPKFPGDEKISIKELAKWPFVIPPVGSPLRVEIETLARAAHVEMDTPVEVDGVRLISDLVAAGDFVSIVPDLAVSRNLKLVKILKLVNAPTKTVSHIRSREAKLSIADEVLRENLLSVAKQATKSK